MQRHMLVVATLLAFTSLARADGPSLPEEDAPRGKTRDQAIDAYTKDCHATLDAVAWVYEEETRVDECRALDVYQNCNPDTFGCESARETCQSACMPVCGRCQDTCAGGCDECKAACAPGDGVCLRRCAATRADCRERCLRGKDQCQETDCGRTADACVKAATQRLKACSVATCDAWVECYDAQEDYEVADKKCQPKFSGYDAFCQDVCRMHHGIPTWYLDEESAPEPARGVDGKTLAKACTAAANCPTDYAAVAPYLGSFCSGTTDDASFDQLAKTVARGAISKRTLGLTFNLYGAMYGYEFKKETWMNGFFYGGGAWLPESCRGRIKSVANAKSMPFRLTKLRDRFKQIWNAAP